MRMGGVVLPGEDYVQRGWGGRSRSLGSSDEKVLGSRRRYGNSLEERTPFHDGSL
jgi:hypothetical protein